MAPPKPGPPSAGGSKFSNKGQSTGTTGARLWEKKPSSFKGPSKHGGAPGGPRSFKSGPSEGGKPYQSNFKKRKPDTDAELTPDAKKARKQLTAEQIKERKALKPNASLVSEVLRLWGIFSQKSTPKEEKHKLISELLKLSEGKIVDIVFRGTASRVFQSVLKEGNAEHRSKVFHELKDEVLTMAKNAYAHRLLMRLLHYATIEQTDVLIPKFYGHVCNLMRQRDASRVLEYIYSTEEIGRPLQKLALVEEFYGVAFETLKPKSKRTLEDILAAHPEKKSTILAHLRAKLMPIINKADMSTLLNHTIVHLPLLKLFETSSPAENQETIEALKDNLVRIVHSKEGAKVACMCIAYATPKTRKNIVKSMKGYVVRIATEQHGHIVLLRLFDVMDDTVLVNKSILSEIKPELLKLAEDRFGRVVLLYLLAPTKRYFTAETLDILKPAFLPDYILSKKAEAAADDEDEESKSAKKEFIVPTHFKMVPTSKKESAIRQTELYNAIAPELRNMALAQTFRMLSHIYARDVIFETIVTSTAVVDEDEKEKLLGAVLRLVGEPSSDNKKTKSEDDEDEDNEEEDEVSKKFHALDFLREKPIPEEDIMTHSLVHRMLRRFIDEESGFDELLLEKIGDNLWDYTSKTYSSWVVYSLLQSPNTGAKVSKVLSAHKKELAELAKVDLNKAAQAIQLYMKDPTASKSAAQSHGASEKTSAPKAAKTAEKKQQVKEKEKEKKKIKSTPLVADDEEVAHVERHHQEDNNATKEEAEPESKMDVDEPAEEAPEAKTSTTPSKASTPSRSSKNTPSKPSSAKKSDAKSPSNKRR